MKSIIKKLSFLPFLTLLFACALFFAPAFLHQAAAADLDEILNYTITVDVNDDATLNMVYEIDWKVLDSDSEGPLSWVTVGVPNKHYISYEALTPTIKNLSYTSSNGGSLRIDFDREYFKDEVVSFKYRLVQDYMYEMNMLTDGETVFSFTPGWFDSLVVDNFTLRWNSASAESWSPACSIDSEGYCKWTSSLGKGETLPVTVTYLNNAFAFDESKTLERSIGQDDVDNAGSVVFGIFFLLIFICVLSGIINVFRNIFHYEGSSGFTTSNGKKITRTKIEYYPACPGCGATRPEGKDNCEYCGRSFIKSEEKIEEKDIPASEAEIKNKKENGLYRYSSSPNTYVRVNVVNIPVHHSSSSYSSRSSSRSSCVHSSCACAHCACACACACAGGGRAGCTTKDFYNTRLKLKQIVKGLTH